MDGRKRFALRRLSHESVPQGRPPWLKQLTCQFVFPFAMGREPATCLRLFLNKAIGEHFVEQTIVIIAFALCKFAGDA